MHASRGAASLGERVSDMDGGDAIESRTQSFDGVRRNGGEVGQEKKNVKKKYD